VGLHETTRRRSKLLDAWRHARKASPFECAFLCHIRRLWEGPARGSRHRLDCTRPWTPARSRIFDGHVYAASDTRKRLSLSGRAAGASTHERASMSTSLFAPPNSYCISIAKVTRGPPTGGRLEEEAEAAARSRRLRFDTLYLGGGRVLLGPKRCRVRSCGTVQCGSRIHARANPAAGPPLGAGATRGHRLSVGSNPSTSDLRTLAPHSGEALDSAARPRRGFDVLAST